MDYLNDVATSIHYDRQVPYQDDLLKEAQYGTRLWKSEQENDPWELLAAAVISHAAKDYVQAVVSGDEKGAEVDRQFFRKNGFLENILMEIDRMIRNAQTQRERESLCRRMRLFW